MWNQVSLFKSISAFNRATCWTSHMKSTIDASNIQSGTYESLNKRHRVLAEGGMPPAIYENYKFKWEIGDRFGLFGVNSGIDIRRLWPSIEEIEEKNALKLYRKYADSKKISQQAAYDEEEKIRKRKEEIAKNFSLYGKQLEQFKQSRKKVETELSEQEAKQQKRICEIQEYFGYWIDPKDPRFTVMLKQKEEEQNQAAKKAKKDAKKARQTCV